MCLTLSLWQKVLIMQVSLHSFAALSPPTTRGMPMHVWTYTTQVAGGSLYCTLCRCRVRTSPCPKALIFPVNRESDGEIKCPGRRLTADHRPVGKPGFSIQTELLNQVICSTEIPFVWHSGPIAVWSRTTLDPCLKTKVPPSSEDLN